MKGGSQLLLRLAGLALLLALLTIALRSIDLAGAAHAMRAAHVGWLAAATLAFFAILPLWAMQWHLLSPSTRTRRRHEMFATVAIASSVHNTTWVMAGETASVLLLVKRMELDRSSAVAVLLMDQLIVGVAKVALLVSTVVWLPLPGALVRGIATLAAGVAAFLIVLLALGTRHDAISSITARWLPLAWIVRIGGVGRALAPVRDRRGALALLLAFAKQGCELTAIVCVQRAFGMVLPLSGAILVLAALNLATLIPVVPGNAGVYEAAIVWTYVRMGISAERAAAMAIVQHACYFAALAMPGYYWLAESSTAARNEAATP